MNRLTLDDVADYLQDFHRYGTYAMAICPYHDDHSPSMMVNDYGFKCKSCDAHGSLRVLYQHVSGRVVLQEKANHNQSASIWYKWEEKFGPIQNIAKVGYENLGEYRHLGSYLYNRGFTDVNFFTGKIGYLDGYYTFPVLNYFREVVGLVIRASPSIQTKHNRYSVSKNCPQKLYCPDYFGLMNYADEIHVVFGTIDTWSLTRAGRPWTVTGLAGQTMNSEHFDKIRKPIWIIPDKGEERSAMDLQIGLGWRGATLLIDWPEGCKDLNDIEVKYGARKVFDLVETAKEKYRYD